MDLEPETTDNIVEVEAPEIPDEPKSKTGDVYQLGRHRLMCGDSTKSSDVTKLMNGATADLIVTDPPYNVNYESKDRLIENDDMDRENFYYFLLRCFENATEQIKAGGGVLRLVRIKKRGGIFKSTGRSWTFCEARNHLEQE